MSANYKNWVPNGMITALTAGTAILGAGTAALMFTNMNPMMKKALVGTVGAGTLVCGAMAAWSIYAHGKFSYDGKRHLSKEIVEGLLNMLHCPKAVSDWMSDAEAVRSPLRVRSGIRRAEWWELTAGERNMLRSVNSSARIIQMQRAFRIRNSIRAMPASSIILMSILTQ